MRLLASAVLAAALLAGAPQKSQSESALAAHVAALAERGDRHAALEAAAAAVDRMPNSRRLKELYTYLLLSTVSRADAYATLSRLVEQDPAEPVYKLELGKLIFDRDPLEARGGELIRDAAAALPRSPSARYYRAQWLCVYNEHEKCLAELRETLKLTDPANTEAQMQLHAMMAVAEDALGRPEKAEPLFRIAREANAKLPNASPATETRYAEFLLKYGRTDEAKAVLDAVLRRSPGFAQALVERAVLLEQSESFAEAAAQAERGLAGAGDNAKLRKKAHSVLARVYFQLGDETKAAEHRAWLEANQTARPE